MPAIQILPGVLSDLPWATPFGTMKAGRGLNIRWRLGQMETLGLFGPLRNLAGDNLQVPLLDNRPVRALYTIQGANRVQILAGGLNRIDLIDVDPASPGGADTRYRVTQLGTTLTPTAVETLPSPTLKATPIGPVWWFAEQDRTVIGGRAGVNESVRSWDRDPANGFAEIPAYEPGDTPGSPTGDAPRKAVGGGVLNGIAVLLGCDSFSEVAGEEALTVRWSARRNFQLWDPTIIIDPVTGQANISGEFQLERGSRIIGGGQTGFGIVAWTDKAMVTITETNNLATVLRRDFVDGARGLLTNRSWCEADGRIWWLDGSRTLNVYDGGRAQDVENPMRRGTIDRVNEGAVSRAYMAANPEFGEILIFYPSGDAVECDRAMVFNYRENAWSIWGLSRSHWYPRQGIQEAVAIDLGGTIYAHDVGPACPNAFRPDALLPLGPGTGCGDGNLVGASNLTGISGFVEFGPMVSPEAGKQTFSGMRLLASWLPTPAIGAETDELQITLMGFDNANVRDTRYEETQDWAQRDTVRDYRVSGRAVSLRVEFTEIKTVYRLGYVDLTLSESDGGER